MYDASTLFQLRYGEDGAVGVTNVINAVENNVFSRTFTRFRSFDPGSYLPFESGFCLASYPPNGDLLDFGFVKEKFLRYYITVTARVD